MTAIKIVAGIICIAAGAVLLLMAALQDWGRSKAATRRLARWMSAGSLALWISGVALLVWA